MDPTRNPFSPGAGTQPPELAGRRAVLEDAIIALERAQRGRSAKGMMLLGLRGVGKTVLLNRISHEAESRGYLAELVEAPDDRRLASLLAPHLKTMLLKLSRTAIASDQISKAARALRNFAAAFKVAIGEVTIEVSPDEGAASTGDIESDLPELILPLAAAAKERGRAIALLIDEVQYLTKADLGAVIVTAHKASQRGLPFVFFGAGLPQLAGLAGDAKSYAERLFAFPEIGQLDPDAARLAIEEPIKDEGASITDRAIELIVERTRGYPYFLQEWGYQTWNQAEASAITEVDVSNADDLAVSKLDAEFFRVRFDRLTPKEQEYLRAMAELGPGPHRSGEIADRLGKEVQSLAPRRTGLIKKGMIYSPAHGDTAFTVPMFDAFLKRQMPGWTP